MCLPTLDRLAASGIHLRLAGRPWAVQLLQAYDWPVTALAPGRWQRVAQLRALAAAQPQDRAALLLTNSFSSALEFRLGGLLPMGYASDARRFLLCRAIAIPAAWRANMHTVDYYIHLAQNLLQLDTNPAPQPQLRLCTPARERARAALHRAGARARYIVLCPVAQGRHRGRVKSWAGFGRLSRELLAKGHEVLICPGPGEREAAHDACPDAREVGPLDVGAFAALLAGSKLVVANDSGPAHLAAAVGARLVGVFGVTDPGKTRPLGADLRLVGGLTGWPTYEDVAATVAAMLD